MKIRDMALCALFVALMAVCAWITVPLLDIAFTMQTFALFLTLGLLGGKRGSIVCLVYLLLGAAGFPVFSGFRGGAGVLLGVTGGYIWGFLATAVVYWLVTAVGGQRKGIRTAAMVLGMLACYVCGSLWFMHMYVQGGNAVGSGAVLAKCVVPYLVPDGLKLLLAVRLIPRLKRFL